MKRYFSLDEHVQVLYRNAKSEFVYFDPNLISVSDNLVVKEKLKCR